MDDKKNKNEATSYMGMGVAIGVSIGAALGVVTGDMVWMGAGIAIGVAIGVSLDRERGNHNTSGTESEPDTD